MRRMRWANLGACQLAVAVAIGLLQCLDRASDLVGRDLAVTIGIERKLERMWGRRRWTASIRRWWTVFTTALATWWLSLWPIVLVRPR